MLTSVKVQLGACLVDCEGIAHLPGRSFIEGEEDFKATRETGRDAEKRRRGRAQLSSFGGMQDQAPTAVKKEICAPIDGG